MISAALKISGNQILSKQEVVRLQGEQELGDLFGEKLVKLLGVLSSQSLDNAGHASSWILLVDCIIVEVEPQEVGVQEGSSGGVSSVKLSVEKGVSKSVSSC